MMCGRYIVINVLSMQAIMKNILLTLMVLTLSGCGEGNKIITSEMSISAGLSKGICPLIHCDTQQSDTFDVVGPISPSKILSKKEIDLLWSSPIAGGVLDYIYPDGQRVFWVPQVDRIMKLRLNSDNTLEKIAEMPLQPKDYPRFSPEDMQEKIRQLDDAQLNSEKYEELADFWDGYQTEGLRAYYAMVNNAGILYVSNRNGVVAYTDSEPGNPASGITKVGQYTFAKLKLQLGLRMPMVILIGMNMTPDGHIIAVTIDGTVIGIKPDLSDAYYHNLKGEQIWNSIAIDSKDGIYLTGNKAMHKLVWTDTGFSTKLKDGAWSVPYENGELNDSLRAGRGSGTTPALMGSPQDEDRFVVSADGADVNNLIFYWRDEIPDDWKQLPGTSSPRIAGIMPVNFGDNSLNNSYSECSATMFEYGALLANNAVKTNEAMTMDVQLKMKDPARTPFGIQKFHWNPATQQAEVAWSRDDVSSPNSVPIVSKKDRGLHAVGIKDGKWVWETLDWDSGKTRAVYVLGESERFNPIMLALQLLPNGDPIYPAFGGVVHLRLGEM